MSERRQQIQVGIIFIFSLAVLIAGILWFKDFRLGGQSQEVQVAFPSASGLVKGDPVEVRGVVSGEVTDIRYEGGRSIVALSLDKSIEFRPGSRFVIENVGIMGQKLVAVYPGTEGEPIAPANHVFEGTYQPGIPELMDKLGESLETFHRLGLRVEEVVNSLEETDQGSLRRTLGNLESVTEDLAVLLRSSRGEMDDALKNFNLAMNDLRRVFEGREEDVTTMLDNVVRASTRMESTLVALELAAKSVQDLSQELGEGDGTLGRLMQDEQLYEEMVTTLGETRKLVEDIQTNPKKYVKLSIF